MEHDFFLLSSKKMNNMFGEVGKAKDIVLGGNIITVVKWI